MYDPTSSSNATSSRRPTLLYINFSPEHHELRKKGLEAFKEIGTIQVKRATQF